MAGKVKGTPSADYFEIKKFVHYNLTIGVCVISENNMLPDDIQSEDLRMDQ